MVTRWFECIFGLIKEKLPWDLNPTLCYNIKGMNVILGSTAQHMGW